jgi:hypothetical protein
LYIAGSDAEIRSGKTTANTGVALHFLCAFASLRQKRKFHTVSTVHEDVDTMKGGIMQARVIYAITIAITLVFLTAATTSGQTGATGIVNRNANLRSGPGTGYTIVGSAKRGAAVTIAATNRAGTWHRLSDGKWIAAWLVDTPVASRPATAPASAPAPSASQPVFRVVEQRLWNVEENGGWLDGPSVHCGAGRELLVNVLDAAGRRINGVAVQALFGARETVVTGAQGKGDGVAKFVLGGGQEVMVVRDAGGLAVTSETATNMSTNPQNIPTGQLINARYCQDEETCRQFAEGNGCLGHFSWTVTFQRAPATGR